MEVLVGEDHYCLRQGPEALLVSRATPATLFCASAGDVSAGGQCLGHVYGWVGVLRSSGGEGDCDYLLLVADADLAALHPFTEAPIRLLRRLLAIPLDGSSPPTDLSPCPIHSVSLTVDTGEGTGSLSLLQKGGSKLGRSFKSLQKAKAPVVNGELGGPTSNRRLIEDVLRLFNEQQSFYYCEPGADLTRSIRLLSAGHKEAAFLHSFDERFMWNRELVAEAMVGSEGDERWRHWVLGLVQGFVGQGEWTEPGVSKRLGEWRKGGGVQVAEAMVGSEGDERWRHWVLGLVQGFVGQGEWTEPGVSKRLGEWRKGGGVQVAEAMVGSEGDERWRHWVLGLVQGFVGQGEWTEPGVSKRLGLTVISRRSRHRAGTRYIKRGIDDNGNVANCVETEQILRLETHCLAFLQVRGSVPLYWSQPGYKYRPPPRLDRDKEASLPVFRRHLADLLHAYGEPLVILNLINQTGSEHRMGEAFLEHFLDAELESVVFAAFDFHEQCRGLQFRNVARLLDALEPQFQAIRFTWACPSSPPMCQQNGVMRVNCMDCLDRTNVVMMYGGRRALEMQLTKLGLLSPDEKLNPNLTTLLNRLWADNGDAISRQYAGTAALKGDFTRSGQRNLVGVMKDGYNSASRYYLGHLRDASRQAAIDLLLGHRRPPLSVSEEEEEEEAEHESLRLLVKEWQAFFLPESESLLGSWALVDADEHPNSSFSDVDSIIILTKEALYLGDYCGEMDKFTDCARVDLVSLRSAQIGPAASGWHIRKGNASDSDPYCLRITYAKEGGEEGEVTWRAGKTRLFNNLAIPIRSASEGEEYLRAIGEQIVFAAHLPGLDSVNKIERRTRRINAFISGVADAGGDALKGAGGAIKGAGGALRSRLAGLRKNKAEPHSAAGLVFSSDVPVIQLDGKVVGEEAVGGGAEESMRASHSEGSGLGLIGRISSVPATLFDLRNSSSLPGSVPKIPVHPFQALLPRVQASKANVILL